MTVARREYRAVVRSKAFILLIVLMPGFLFGGVLVENLLQGRIDLADKKLVVLDATGQLHAGLTEFMDWRNRTQILDEASGLQIRPRYLLEPGPPAPFTDQLRLALSQRCRRNEIGGFVEIGAQVLEDGAAGPEAQAIVYSEDVDSEALEYWVERAVHEAVQSRRLQRFELDAALVRRAVAPVKVRSLGLFVQTEAGQIRKADEARRVVAILVPVILLAVMWMSILMVGQQMLEGVVTEKQQRVAEVLLGCAPPFELMLGKLLGCVGAVLTMVGVYLLGGYALAHHHGYLDLVPMDLLGWFLLYQVLATLLFGSMYLAIGAACTDMKDAQQLLMPVMVLLCLPLMPLGEVLRQPMSGFATGLSFFPPATPMLMVLRLSVTRAVPVWQPLAGAGVVALATLLCVLAAGRVFRIGFLAQGKAPRFTELARWMARG
jgi:ABC-2 type transport system permease protein